MTQFETVLRTYPRLICLALALLTMLGVVSLGQSLLPRQPDPETDYYRLEVWPAVEPLGTQSVQVLATLLAVNEQAAGLAGYPALVAAGRRRAVAGQAARQIAGLARGVGEMEGVTDAASTYVERQIAILESLRRSLDEYAAGKGAAGVSEASAANATLREELAELLGSTQEERR